MHYIKEQVLSGRFMAGTWSNLASSITTEMAARTGFDWLLIDQEHGPGDNLTLLHQIQAVGERPCAVIVRIVWNEMPLYKRVLDLGASGVMVPYVETAEQAVQVVRYMRYPPQGLRGAAATSRAAGFGDNFQEYFSQANQSLLTVVQIETELAVRNAGEIAAVDGVDVLFVGPLDLSLSVNLPGRFEDPAYCEILAQVASAAKSRGKAAGILLPSVQLLDLVCGMGYSFVAVGSDGGMVLQGLKANLAAMSELRK